MEQYILVTSLCTKYFGGGRREKGVRGKEASLIPVHCSCIIEHISEKGRSGVQKIVQKRCRNSVQK